MDRDRRPGRFLLTGSTNVLLLPALADSLAGRLEIIRLHPLAQGELHRVESTFLDALFGAGFKARPYERLGKDLIRRIVDGGYPAAIARATPRRRATWYRDYVEALVQRDVRDLAAPFQLSRPTIREYVTLLERIFLLETFVLQELRRQASWRDDDIRFHHVRDKDGTEVDLVIEQGGRALAAVEVKAGATVTAGDFRGIRRLQGAVGKRFACGVVLYDGEASVRFGDGLFAVPLRALWEPQG